MKRVVAAALAAVAVLPAACGSSTPSLDQIGARYAQTALRLAQHDPSLVDAWRGPERLEPGPRGPVNQIAADIAVLREDTARAGAGLMSGEGWARWRYLSLQVDGLRFAADRLLGRVATLDEQAKEEFGIALVPLDTAAVKRQLAAIDKLLPGKDALRARVSDLRRSIRVPEDERDKVLQLALSACKDASSQVFPLPAEAEIHINMSTFQQHQGWDGFADHTEDFETQIWINEEVPLDVSRALRLACHEGYPGHHVQHVLIDQLFETRQWLELRLTPAFGRHHLLSEGAAELASDLAFPAAARAALYREKLFPAANVDDVDADLLVRFEDLQRELLPVITDVARGYLAGTLSEERARERLDNEALVEDADVMLQLIKRQRVRALVYGEGRRVMASLLPSRDLAGLRALMHNTAALQ